jgi:hypothetical protein
MRWYHQIGAAWLIKRFKVLPAWVVLCIGYYYLFVRRKIVFAIARFWLHHGIRLVVAGLYWP